MRVSSGPRWDRETTLVSQLAATASLFAFLLYFRHGTLLLYGDAVAHLNIARRIFDSRTPGLLQLGTVWLPLPHLLMAPFLISDSAWRTGIGGSIPSMVAYVLGSAGVLRLLRVSLGGSPADANARAAAWTGALIYAANPNLIYMQATAMTESLYLAFFIWAAVYVSEFAQACSEDRTNAPVAPLTRCGLCLTGACLTRYDGWFLAGAALVLAVVVVVRPGRRDLFPALLRFGLMALSAPLFWLAYNAVIYRNPLEFANGPYSALAIEQTKTAMSAISPHPGWHQPVVAFDYLLKSAEHNMAEGVWQKIWVAALIAGIVMLASRPKKRPLLLLLVPLLFYPLSIAYGSIPVYLPDWWPFSYYNVRFGLELLPAFSAAAALIVHCLLGLSRDRWRRIAVAVGVVVITAGSYASVWRAQPICFQEARVNSRTRIPFETSLASNLEKLPHDSTLLMYLGDHVGALQSAGIRLRRTINEGNHRPWRKPSDPEGLWERALANPERYADYAVAIAGDPVSESLRRRNLPSMLVIHTSGEPPATIFWTHAPPR